MAPFGGRYAKVPGIAEQFQEQGFDPRTGGQGGGVGGRIGGLIDQGFESGAFDPMGSARIKALRRASVLRNLRNRMQRARILGQSGGFDPSQAQAFLRQSESEGSRDIADALGEGDLQDALGGQEFARGLLGSERRFEFERQENARARKAAEKAQRGAMLGELGGVAAGSFLPVPGGNPMRTRRQLPEDFRAY